MTDSQFVQLVQNPNNALSWWQLRDTEAHFEAELKKHYGAFWQQARVAPVAELNPVCAMWARALKQAEFEWREICQGAV
jgi:hypothetical protein